MSVSKIILTVFILAIFAMTGPALAQDAPGPVAFNYGFDFSVQGPDDPSQDIIARRNDPQSVTAARQVMASFPGILMDVSIYGAGAQHNPEPSPGVYDFSSIASRIQLVTKAKGIPVITLVQSPQWMHTDALGDHNNMKRFALPPTPDHFQDFADLCAQIAVSFPQVKYFVVWSELRGFYNNDEKATDIARYTDMYNAVYKAIKKVRPDALVGGPYATMTASLKPNYKHPWERNDIHGEWGYLKNADMEYAVSYWLQHKVGADFIAIDGRTDIASIDDGGRTDEVASTDISHPLKAIQLYAAVDQWIKSQTDLPIWWMESHIAPAQGWTEEQGAAARIAALATMNATGASAGLQWQPQGQQDPLWPDEGLWTSTLQRGGGQPTVLAHLLRKYLPVLQQRLTLVPGQPSGVLATVTPGNQLLLVNTNNDAAVAYFNNKTFRLGADAVRVKNIPQ